MGRLLGSVRRVHQICPTTMRGACTDKLQADGKIPLIALDDVGYFSLWLFDHPEKAAGMDLKVATDQVSMADIAAAFTRVTGKEAHHVRLPLEEYLPKAEPYPNAWANWAAGPNIQRDESAMTWRENFSAWWLFWGEGKGADRNMALLDRIHPKRIKSVEEWMRLKQYDGKPKAVLKGVEDLRAMHSTTSD
jgi:hypothetical protein